MAASIRLFVDHPLGAGQTVPLDGGQANYLFNVMRLGVGDAVALFNSRDGEWSAAVAQAGKRRGVLTCMDRTAPLRMPPDLWLLFAPIKKARTDFIVEKATELGAARIIPVQTAYTNADRIRRDRLQAHAVEAAEQCGGTYVPEVADLIPLGALLDDWPADRTLVFCDESRAGPATDLQVPEPPGPRPGPRAEAQPDAPARAAILIGPEGGFSPAERDLVAALPQSRAISLGPRILRADTAAVAALTLWQAAKGDWR